jgi:hypothetical protein
MPKYKPQIIRVNLSQSFMTRSRCKSCGSKPDDPDSMYFYVRSKALWYNPNIALAQANSYQKYSKKWVGDYYLLESPKDFNTTKYFNYSVWFNTYRPKLHRTRGSNPVEDGCDCITCGCGGTVWVFSQFSARGRPEISQRCAKNKYTHKYVY